MFGVKNTFTFALIAISASTITHISAEVKAQGKGYFCLTKGESKEGYISNLMYVNSNVLNF